MESNDGCCKLGGAQISEQRHMLINIGIGIAAAGLGAACLASVVCGGGALVSTLGMAVVTTNIVSVGVAAHTILAKPSEKALPPRVWTKSTTVATAKGFLCGILAGRGCLTTVISGPTQSSPANNILTRFLNWLFKR